MITNTEKDPQPDGKAFACSTEQTQLGEGIRWDDRRGELLAVDILAGRVARGLLRKDGLIERVGVYQLPGTVGMIAPIQGDDGWVLGAGRGFVHLALDGTQRTIAQVAPAGTRMNDGACDPQGRFWGGTLADDHHTGGGALYRLDRTGRTEVVLEDLTISNGIGWSPDGRTMYLVDSGPRVVHAFTFDGDRGTISAGRVLVTVPEDIGAPDGMTVDAAGDLWVAIYGGGRVNRYAPDGSLRDVYPIPARVCTCCAFGGPGLHQLFVTTATEGWTDEQRRSDLDAGLVYRVDTDATGQPAAPFRPDPAWWEGFTRLRRTTSFETNGRRGEDVRAPDGMTVGTARGLCDQRRRRARLPVDTATWHLLRRQHGRCPLCRGLLLHADHQPQGPEEWQQWHTATRTAIRKHAITTVMDLGTPDERAAHHLIHAHCRHRIGDGTSPALLPGPEPSELA